MTQIFIEYENTVITFPVNPGEILLKKDGNNETLDIVSLGQINVLKGAKLGTLEFSSFFPANASGSYVLTKGGFKGPSYYIDFINKIRNAKKHCRLIVSGTKINLLASIEKFEYGVSAGPAGEIQYSIGFKEYKSYAVKEVKVSNYGSIRPTIKNVVTQIPKAQTTTTPKKTVTTTKQATPPVKKKPYVGCKVRVNGRLHRDSYGGGPGQTKTNYTGKINFIKTDGRKCPYHVTTPSGGWLGWVLPGAVEVIS